MAKSRRSHVFFAVLYASLAVLPQAQTTNQDADCVVKGIVRDRAGSPVSGATLQLKNKATHQISTARSDSKGLYSFAQIGSGTYSLYVDLKGLGEASSNQLTLDAGETKTVDLTLAPATTSASAPPFYDEPKFTVSGVTATGNAGGHGSDLVVRTSEALAKETASLGKAVAEPAGAADLKRSRDALRAQLSKQDNADLHHQLADVAEKLSDPLTAVREYQRAAEMQPSEQYYFDWGTELLVHRALQPATDVFARGHHLFPKSERMLVGLAVSEFTRGTYDQALQHIATASDLNPSDPMPYVFLAKMQTLDTVNSPLFLGKFKRLAQLQPENALANYYYAVALWKSMKNSGIDESRNVEELLEKAIRLDSNLGGAHLQLGIVLAQIGEMDRAVAEYQKAIAADASLVEAHYRLAQAYRRAGQKEQADRELQLYGELSKKSSEQAEKERREIQEFVVTMRSDNKSQPQ